jgi:Kef-type K+ transport system membrane component KefB
MHLDNPILILLTQVALVLLASRAVGWLFARFHQPQVMGEMVAGILLGPSLFGWLAPHAHAAIFPPATIPMLNVLSQVGVIFFLFLIGLELDPKLLRNRGHAAVVISHVSIIAPFLLGAALTLYLYPRLFNSAPTMKFSSVALFMGAAMSITAFPVLARILTERNLHKTNIGAVAITCAAVDDVTAWCMLAFVVGFARAAMVDPPNFPAHATAITSAVITHSSAWFSRLICVLSPVYAKKIGRRKTTT